MKLRFDKYEGLGNDFIVVEATSTAGYEEPQVKALCDRHFGVGADGVLLVVPPASAGARARMIVLNADGSRPEMCGNGIRCVALYLALRDGAPGISYVIDTDAGPLPCAVERDGAQAWVEVGMGRAQLLGPHRARFEGRELELRHVSMGNPHLVTFDEPLDPAHADRLGPALSAGVPGGSNVELARIAAPDEIELLVWERGVGRTLACGTGACATAVAAVVAGKAHFDKPVRVRLPGGPLDITVQPETLAVRMRGPARRVFSGDLG